MDKWNPLRSLDSVVPSQRRGSEPWFSPQHGAPPLRLPPATNTRDRFRCGVDPTGRSSDCASPRCNVRGSPSTHPSLGYRFSLRVPLHYPIAPSPSPRAPPGTAFESTSASSIAAASNQSVASSPFAAEPTTRTG